MVLPELVLQVVQVVHLVALRGADVLMAGQPLYLTQVMLPEPAGDHAAADLFCINHFRIQLPELMEHIFYPVIDIAFAGFIF